MTRKYYYFIFILLFLGSKTGAQNPEWIVYNKSNSGLPADYILCLTTDHNGNFWIGGEFSNVTKFDGINWSVHNANQAEIISLAADSQNNIWVGSDGGPLTKFTNNSFARYLPERPARYVAVDKNDNVWVGNHRGLSIFDGINWTHYDTTNSDLPFTLVSSITTDQNTIIWASGSKDTGVPKAGLVKFDGMTWITYSTFIPVQWTQSIAVDGNDNKWIGTARLLVKFDDQVFIPFSPPDPSLNYLGAIAIDANENKWIGFDGGLAKFDNSNWQIWTPTNSDLPADWVTAVTIDKYGNKWLGTYGGGLAVFNENGVVTNLRHDNLSEVPSDFVLHQNYPNPFNLSTTIRFDLPKSAKTALTIYNVLGQGVRTFTINVLQKGRYIKNWDGKDDAGLPMPSGVYFYRLLVLDKEDFVKTHKMVLLR